MIIERELLIEQLEQIQCAAYNLVEENDAAMFLPSLLYYIGDADPYLRDELIYTCFVSWIEEKDYFEDHELESLAVSLSGPLFLGRGLVDPMGGESEAQGRVNYKRSLDPNHDVLVRSFSALVLTSLLNKNQRQPILSDEILLRISSQLCITMGLEHDLRSYDETLGWVHPLAHYSDLCGACLRQEKVNPDLLPNILKAFQTQLESGVAVWTGQEEERFISAVYEALIVDGRAVSETLDVPGWISALGQPGTHDDGILNMRVLINKKQMLRSLYFRGLKRGMDIGILEMIQKSEAALCRFK